MKLVVKRSGLFIVPDNYPNEVWFHDQDLAYIEDTLGLKNKDDSIKLTRTDTILDLSNQTMPAILTEKAKSCSGCANILSIERGLNSPCFSCDRYQGKRSDEFVSLNSGVCLK